MKKLVVIESPFAADNDADLARNKRYLQAAMRDCLLRGEAPYASHGLYTQEGVLDDTIPAERAMGIEAGFLWRQVADLTAVYDDLGISGGMAYGIEDALKRHTQVVYRTLGHHWDKNHDSLQQDTASEHPRQTHHQD